jgi:hypothetical protein
MAEMGRGRGETLTIITKVLANEAACGCIV